MTLDDVFFFDSIALNGQMRFLSMRNDITGSNPVGITIYLQARGE